MTSNTSVECTQPFLRFPEVAGATWTRLQPLASTVQHDLQRLCAPMLDNLRPYFHEATQWTDRQLTGLPPWQIAVLATASTWLALTLYRWVSNIVADIRDVGKAPTIKHNTLKTVHTSFMSALPCNFGRSPSNKLGLLGVARSYRWQTMYDMAHSKQYNIVLALQVCSRHQSTL